MRNKNKTKIEGKYIVGMPRFSCCKVFEGIRNDFHNIVSHWNCPSPRLLEASAAQRISKSHISTEEKENKKWIRSGRWRKGASRAHTTSRQPQHIKDQNSFPPANSLQHWFSI
jgi:hypothetical protein